MKHLLTILFISICFSSYGQSWTTLKDVKITYMKGIKQLAFPNTCVFYSTSDSVGATWFDSASTKKLKYQGAQRKEFIASEHWVDSLFGTAVTGVTQQTLDDSCAAIRSSASGTDSAIFSTKWYRNKGVDSVSALVLLRVKYTDSAAMLLPYLRKSDTTSMLSVYLRKADTSTLSNRINLKVNIADTSNMLTPYIRKSDTGTYATQYRVDSAVSRTRAWALSTFGTGSGSVTSVAAGFGTSFTTITTTGSVTIDTGLMATRLRVQKAVDSLNVIIGTKGTGSVTSVASGYGLSGGTITTTGTLTPDTTLLVAYTDTSKTYGIMTLKKVLALGYSTTTGTVTSVASGYGLNGGTITSSGTLTPDTTLLIPFTDTSKTYGIVTEKRLLAKGYGTGSVTSVASGYGLSGGTITTTGTLTPDTTLLIPFTDTSKTWGVMTRKKVTDLGYGTGTVTSVSGTTDRITSTGGTTPVIDIASTYVGQTSITTLGTIATGTWNGTRLTSSYIPTNTAYLDVAQSYTKGQAGTPSALTDASTIAVDLSLSNNFRVQLGGNRTLGVPTNILAGQTGYINFWQDITGTRTLAYSWCYNFASATAPTLSTGKLTMDKLSYAVDYYSTATVTMTIATPCVVTHTAHGLYSGAKVQFTTTGALPTGVSASTTYYITVVDANSYKLSTTFANAQAATFVASSGSQSGVHTGTAIGISAVLNVDVR